MRQRGRRSATVVAFPGSDEPRPHITPPAGPTKAERVLFIELTTAVGHLSPVDAPLLATYVQGSLLTRQLARQPATAVEWERAARTTAALGRALRLTPQSRIGPRSVGRRLPTDAAPSIYEQGLDDLLVEDDDGAV